MTILEYTNQLIQEITINIKIKHNKSSEEVRIENTIKQLYKNYKIPPLIKKIIINEKAGPSNSHNGIVTINNYRKDNPLAILFILIHEIFHAYFKDDTLFKEYYPKDNGEHSFHLHIGVCWNTRNWLQNNLSRKDVDFIYNKTFQPYPLTEKLVKKDFNKIKKILNKYGLVYR